MSHMPDPDEVMTESGAEYSDFEIQVVQPSHEQKGGNSANSTVFHEYEPLAPIGLSNDEGAELIAITGNVKVGFDAFANTSDQEPGGAEFRGAIGSGMSAEVAQLPGNGNGNGEVTVVDDQGDATDSDARGSTGEEVFEVWDVDTLSSFNDTTNGSGGAGNAANMRITHNFRELYGRGPFLDYNDKIEFITRVVKNNVSTGVEAVADFRLVWDTVELDNADEKFSIPE